MRAGWAVSSQLASWGGAAPRVDHASRGPLTTWSTQRSACGAATGARSAPGSVAETLGLLRCCGQSCESASIRAGVSVRMASSWSLSSACSARRSTFLPLAPVKSARLHLADEITLRPAALPFATQRPSYFPPPAHPLIFCFSYGLRTPALSLRTSQPPQFIPRTWRYLLSCGAWQPPPLLDAAGC